MSAASMNKALWSSAYRTMFLPYRLEKISFIPEVAMDVLFKNKYNYLILNRNYRVISDIGDVNFCGYSSEYQKRTEANLAGSIISFARNPENFKGVWWPHGTYLYDDSVGNCTKNITSYFQRLKKLFTHTHTFIGSRELNTLKECYPNFGQKENEE